MQQNRRKEVNVSSAQQLIAIIESIEEIYNADTAKVIETATAIAKKAKELEKIQKKCIGHASYGIISTNIRHIAQFDTLFSNMKIQKYKNEKAAEVINRFIATVRLLSRIFSERKQVDSNLLQSKVDNFSSQNNARLHGLLVSHGGINFDKYSAVAETKEPRYAESKNFIMTPELDEAIHSYEVFSSQQTQNTQYEFFNEEDNENSALVPIDSLALGAHNSSQTLDNQIDEFKKTVKKEVEAVKILIQKAGSTSAIAPGLYFYLNSAKNTFQELNRQLSELNTKIESYNEKSERNRIFKKKIDVNALGSTAQLITQSLEDINQAFLNHQTILETLGAEKQEIEDSLNNFNGIYSRLNSLSKEDSFWLQREAQTLQDKIQAYNSKIVRAGGLENDEDLISRWQIFLQDFNFDEIVTDISQHVLILRINDFRYQYTDLDSLTKLQLISLQGEAQALQSDIERYNQKINSRYERNQANESNDWLITEENFDFNKIQNGITQHLGHHEQLANPIEEESLFSLVGGLSEEGLSDTMTITGRMPNFHQETSLADPKSVAMQQYRQKLLISTYNGVTNWQAFLERTSNLALEQYKDGCKQRGQSLSSEVTSTIDRFFHDRNICLQQITKLLKETNIAFLYVETALKEDQPDFSTIFNFINKIDKHLIAISDLCTSINTKYGHLKDNGVPANFYLVPVTSVGSPLEDLFELYHKYFYPFYFKQDLESGEFKPYIQKVDDKGVSSEVPFVLLSDDKAKGIPACRLLLDRVLESVETHPRLNIPLTQCDYWLEKKEAKTRSKVRSALTRFEQNLTKIKETCQVAKPYKAENYERQEAFLKNIQTALTEIKDTLQKYNNDVAKNNAEKRNVSLPYITINSFNAEPLNFNGVCKSYQNVLKTFNKWSKDAGTDWKQKFSHAIDEINRLTHDVNSMEGSLPEDARLVTARMPNSYTGLETELATLESVSELSNLSKFLIKSLTGKPTRKLYKHKNDLLSNLQRVKFSLLNQIKQQFSLYDQLVVRLGIIDTHINTLNDLIKEYKNLQGLFHLNLVDELRRIQILNEMTHRILAVIYLTHSILTEVNPQSMQAFDVDINKLAYTMKFALEKEASSSNAKADVEFDFFRVLKYCEPTSIGNQSRASIRVNSLDLHEKKNVHPQLTTYPGTFGRAKLRGSGTYSAMPSLTDPIAKAQKQIPPITPAPSATPATSLASTPTVVSQQPALTQATPYKMDDEHKGIDKFVAIIDNFLKPNYIPSITLSEDELLEFDSRQAQKELLQSIQIITDITNITLDILKRTSKRKGLPTDKDIFIYVERMINSILLNHLPTLIASADTYFAYSLNTGIGRDTEIEENLKFLMHACAELSSAFNREQAVVKASAKSYRRSQSLEDITLSEKSSLTSEASPIVKATADNTRQMEVELSRFHKDRAPTIALLLTEAQIEIVSDDDLRAAGVCCQNLKTIKEEITENEYLKKLSRISPKPAICDVLSQAKEEIIKAEKKLIEAMEELERKQLEYEADNLVALQLNVKAPAESQSLVKPRRPNQASNSATSKAVISAGKSNEIALNISNDIDLDETDITSRLQTLRKVANWREYFLNCMKISDALSELDNEILLRYGSSSSSTTQDTQLSQEERAEVLVAVYHELNALYPEQAVNSTSYESLFGEEEQRSEQFTLTGKRSGTNFIVSDLQKPFTPSAPKTAATDELNWFDQPNGEKHSEQFTLTGNATSKSTNLTTVAQPAPIKADDFEVDGVVISDLIQEFGNTKFTAIDKALAEYSKYKEATKEAIKYFNSKDNPNAFLEQRIITRYLDKKGIAEASLTAKTKIKILITFYSALKNLEVDDAIISDLVQGGEFGNKKFAHIEETLGIYNYDDDSEGALQNALVYFSSEDNPNASLEQRIIARYLDKKGIAEASLTAKTKIKILAKFYIALENLHNQRANSSVSRNSPATQTTLPPVSLNTFVPTSANLYGSMTQTKSRTPKAQGTNPPPATLAKSQPSQHAQATQAPNPNTLDKGFGFRSASTPPATPNPLPVAQQQSQQVASMQGNAFANPAFAQPPAYSAYPPNAPQQALSNPQQTIKYGKQEEDDIFSMGGGANFGQNSQPAYYQVPPPVSSAQQTQNPLLWLPNQVAMKDLLLRYGAATQLGDAKSINERIVLLLSIPANRRDSIKFNNVEDQIIKFYNEKFPRRAQHDFTTHNNKDREIALVCHFYREALQYQSQLEQDLQYQDQVLTDNTIYRTTDTRIKNLTSATISLAQQGHKLRQDAATTVIETNNRLLEHNAKLHGLEGNVIEHQKTLDDLQVLIAETEEALITQNAQNILSQYQIMETSIKNHWNQQIEQRAYPTAKKIFTGVGTAIGLIGGVVGGFALLGIVGAGIGLGGGPVGGGLGRGMVSGFEYLRQRPLKKKLEASLAELRQQFESVLVVLKEAYISVQPIWVAEENLTKQLQDKQNAFQNIEKQIALTNTLIEKNSSRPDQLRKYQTQLRDLQKQQQRIDGELQQLTQDKDGIQLKLANIDRKVLIHARMFKVLLSLSNSSTAFQSLLRIDVQPAPIDISVSDSPTAPLLPRAPDHQPSTLNYGTLQNDVLEDGHTLNYMKPTLTKG